MKYLIVNILSKKRSTGVGGGHVRSMVETACQLSRDNEVAILNLGDTFPVKLKNELVDSGVMFQDSPVNAVTVWSAPQMIRCVAKEYGIDAVLCFDHKAYYLCRLCCAIPLILFRCGGPDPGPNYPAAGNVVVYSLENLEWFKKKRPHSNLLFMPHRASMPRLKNVDRKSLGITYEKKVLMRICRLDGTYDWTVKQGAALASEISKTVPVTLVVVGAPISKEYGDALEAETKKMYEDTLFLTHKKFTEKAADLLGLADFVIGTGRGFMEASMAGKKMFCPVKGARFPVGITVSTFDPCFAKNFSGRAMFTDEVVTESIDLVLKAQATSYKYWISDMAKMNFSADQIPSKLEAFVKVSIWESISLVKAIKNGLEIIGFLYVPAFINRKKILNLFKRKG